MTTSPLSAFSSNPAICSSVDLPQPEGPTNATISPGRTDSDTPFNTSSRAAPLPKPRAIFCSVRTSVELLIPKSLHRIEPRRAPRGIETRQQSEPQGDGHDQRNLRDLDNRGQMRQEPQQS